MCINLYFLSLVYDSLVTPQVLQHLTMSVIFITTICVDVQWYCTVVLIHISLTTNDVDYFIHMFIGDLHMYFYDRE